MPSSAHWLWKNSILNECINIPLLQQKNTECPTYSPEAWSDSKQEQEDYENDKDAIGEGIHEGVNSHQTVFFLIWFVHLCLWTENVQWNYY